MDGEIKLWLAQQEIRNEEDTGAEYEFDEGDEGIIEEEYSSQDQQQVPAKQTVFG